MLARLAAIPNLQCLENVPLSRYTRFAIGGPARLLADASTESALIAALATGCPHALIGGGSNLIAALLPLAIALSSGPSPSIWRLSLSTSELLTSDA